MDEEPQKKPVEHVLGADLSRMSVRELAELRERCLKEADRIAAEIEAKDKSRAAADSVFRL